MNTPYTPFEKASRKATWSLLAFGSSVIFGALVFVFDNNDLLNFCILASAAVITLSLSIMSIAIQVPNKGLIALLLSALLVLA